MKKWLACIKKNRLEVLGLTFLLLLSVYFRFYNLNKLAFFTYDQARDALYIKRIIVEHKFRLIGTQSSIPGLYTGPLYYYLMLPFLWLFGLNPIGIDFAIALLGVMTVGLVYFLAKIWSGRVFIAWLVALVFSFQPQILAQSRFAWNPNAIPFFALLFIFSLYKLKEKPFWWMISFLALAVLLQLHYSGVCFLPVLVFWVFVNRKEIDFGKWFGFSFFLFLILMSPLLGFELRHNFTNSRAIFRYLKIGAPGEIPPPPFFPGLWQKLDYLMVEIVWGIRNKLLSGLVILVTIFLGIKSYFSEKKFRQPLILLFLWLCFGVLTASFYRGSFFNFYLTFLYPVGFLLMAILTEILSRQKLWFKGLIILAFLATFFNYYRQLDIFSPPQRTFTDLKSTAKIIAEDISSQMPFNLAGFFGGETFYHNAVDYRYFLETYYHKRALDWEPIDYQQAQILYLISEKPLVKPLETKTMEVLEFKPKKLLKTWELAEDVVIYKLGK